MNNKSVLGSLKIIAGLCLQLTSVMNSSYWIAFRKLFSQMQSFGPVACFLLQYFKVMLCTTGRPKGWYTPFLIMPPLFLPFSWSICSKVCFMNITECVPYLLPAGKSTARILGITPLTCCVLWWLFLYWQDRELTLHNNELKSTQWRIKTIELNFRLHNICEANTILKNGKWLSLAWQDQPL